MTADEILRARIVATARAWIGTPYRHQASLRGAGCDCLGLVRGVFRDIFGTEPERPPPYTAAWAEERAEETLRDAALRHLIPVAREEFGAGDVLLFRLRERGPAKHCAIAVSRSRMIHAYDRHAVAECAIPESWARRLAFAFRFPPPPNIHGFTMNVPTNRSSEHTAPARRDRNSHHATAFLRNYSLGVI